MKCLKLYGPGDLKLEETPAPTISKDEILLKTDVAAICGTDVRMWINGYKDINKNNPLILGHEFTATIVEVGTDVQFYKKGMQVTMAPNIGCGICDQCVAGNFHLCDNYQAFGINIDGAFAEYIKVPKLAIQNGNLMVLPKDVSLEEAALNEPLSCVFSGFLKCNIRAGDIVLIVGSGPVGIMHAQFAKLAGTAKVIMNDLDETRLLESTRIVNGLRTYHGDDLPAFIDSQTNGKGLDVAIVACPAPEMQTAMVPLMNYGGRIMLFGGLPQDKQPVAIDTNIIHYKGLCVTGSARSSISDFRKTMEIVVEGLIDLKSLITARFKFDDILTAFEYAKQGRGLKNIIVF